MGAAAGTVVERRSFNEISGKSCLVTGGSRGIGKATALKLASEGAAIAVHYSRAMDKAEAVCEQIRSLGTGNDTCASRYRR